MGSPYPSYSHDKAKIMLFLSNFERSISFIEVTMAKIIKQILEIGGLKESKIIKAMSILIDCLHNILREHL